VRYNIQGHFKRYISVRYSIQGIERVINKEEENISGVDLQQISESFGF